MSENNKKALQKLIRAAALKLENSLPEVARHPHGRNPTAHIYSVIRATFGSSYKDLSDEYYDAVIEVIDYCVDNPF